MKVSPILGALALSLVSIPAWADVPGAPDAESIPIDALVDPNTPFNLWRPNVFDLVDKKLLTFTGTIVQQLDPTGAPPKPGLLIGYFDWRDEQGVELFSPQVGFGGSPGQPVTITFQWMVDFCPREVSIHFESVEGIFNVVGTFTHECLIPEASTVVPSMALAVGMLGWAWRRRAAQA